MKITTSNYSKTVKQIGLKNLPSELYEAHHFLKTATGNFKNWNVAGSEFHEVRKLAFEKLQQLADHLNGLDGTGKKKETSSYNSYYEAKLMEEFLSFDGKILVKKEIKSFIDELQSAIYEKKIRKISPFAKQINRVQKAVISLYNQKGNAHKVIISDEFRKDLEKAIMLYFNNREEAADDKIDPVELSGTSQEPESKGEIMSSVDFTQKEFSCLGFTGKWLNLIGDPSAGFTAMVFGKPKMGKSFLCVDFAGYLARNFGKVLYVAKEEKLDRTLQEKLKQKDVAHENLFVSDHLPEDLSAYDFVFLDSVNLLGLSPEDLRKLRENNPGKSFVFVFQTTKTGNFRGANSFQHDVDVVIEIPERGKAVQFGRFNQGGEISIFDEEMLPEAKLEGISDKKKGVYPAWTRPKHLSTGDHETLKRIYDLYKKGEMDQAMSAAMNTDTIVREEIPGDIWKKMGGQLTKSREEKLKKKKAVEPEEQKPAAKKILVFHGGVRTMKEVLERAWDLELTDSQYMEILDIAQELDSSFVDMMDNLNHEFNEFFAIMKKAMGEWEEKNGTLAKQNHEKFDPKLFENRSDDENPAFIFNMTSNKVLSDAIRGGFDLIYMVRRELTNRGLDSDGKWVGFDKAKEIHKVEN